MPTGSPAPRLADASPRRSGGLLRLLVVLLVVSAVGVLVWRLSSNGDRAPAPEERAIASEGREERQPEASEPAAIPLPPPAGSPDEGSVDDLPAAEPVVTVPRPTADEVADDTADEDGPAEEPAAVEADVTPVPAADPAPDPAPPDQVRVEMAFSADSWVEVRDLRGQRLIYQLGRQGDRRRVVGVPPLRVFLGFVEGVSIVVDGEPFQVPPERRLGNTARFTIPLDAGAAGGR